SILVTGTCYIIHLIRQRQLVLIENEQLRAENIQNQYQALKNQLNPHMLFNSLNTLLSLVRESPEKAQDYVQELSRVLRYTLQENEFQSVSLREEMNFVEAYIFLMKMRYEENLEFKIHIHENLYEYRLPPLSIQMLVENAIKHNEISNRKPLTISIETNDEKAILSVSNLIQPKRTTSPGTGIGLINLSKRFRLLFKCDIFIAKENGRFCVQLPLIDSKKLKE
ncbi:MAG: histidine kinase, partial [Bacteroides sp.]